VFLGTRPPTTIKIDPWRHQKSARHFRPPGCRAGWTFVLLSAPAASRPPGRERGGRGNFPLNQVLRGPASNEGSANPGTGFAPRHPPWQPPPPRRRPGRGAPHARAHRPAPLSCRLPRAARPAPAPASRARGPPRPRSLGQGPRHRAPALRTFHASPPPHSNPHPLHRRCKRKYISPCKTNVNAVHTVFTDCFKSLKATGSFLYTVKRGGKSCSELCLPHHSRFLFGSVLKRIVAFL
jgi:hypothetical protein